MLGSRKSKVGNISELDIPHLGWIEYLANAVFYSAQIRIYVSQNPVDSRITLVKLRLKPRLVFSESSYHTRFNSLYSLQIIFELPLQAAWTPILFLQASSYHITCHVDHELSLADEGRCLTLDVIGIEEILLRELLDFILTKILKFCINSIDVVLDL